MVYDVTFYRPCSGALNWRCAHATRRQAQPRFDMLLLWSFPARNSFDFIFTLTFGDIPTCTDSTAAKKDARPEIDATPAGACIAASSFLCNFNITRALSVRSHQLVPTPRQKFWMATGIAFLRVQLTFLFRGAETLGCIDFTRVLPLLAPSPGWCCFPNLKLSRCFFKQCTGPESLLGGFPSGMLRCNGRNRDVFCGRDSIRVPNNHAVPITCEVYDRRWVLVVYTRSWFVSRATKEQIRPIRKIHFLTESMRMSWRQHLSQVEYKLQDTFLAARPLTASVTLQCYLC